MDQGSSQRPSSSQLDTLRLVLNEPIDKQSIVSYYLLSKRFVDALIDSKDNQDSLAILCKQQYNTDLIKSWSFGYPILKESLRQGKDYIIITETISELINQLFKGVSMKRTRYFKTERLLAYTTPIKYVVITSERQSEERELELLDHYVMPDISCQAIADELREKCYPIDSYPSLNHILWLSTYDHRHPLTFKQICQNPQLCDTRTLLNQPMLFKIDRHLIRPLFILEIIDGKESQIIPPERTCISHQNKVAQYMCLCLAKRSFACQKQCWTRQKKHVNRCTYVAHDDVDPTIWARNTSKTREYIGLYNQKNMCYFNTAIQCLARAKPLTDYFFDGLEFKDRNYWCKEGTFGSVALHYGQFIRRLLRKQQNKIVNVYKMQTIHVHLWNCIGRWKPQYAQRIQQDAHEFIIKLLEWLKEDLNRNEDLPSYQLLDENIPDSELFKIRKANLKKRNDSIIEDNFQWYLKSVTTCLTCKTKSTSYDSMLTLQLPLVHCPITRGQYRHKIQKQSVNIYYMQNPIENVEMVKMTVESDDHVGFIKKLILAKFLTTTFKHLPSQYGLYKVTKENGYKEVTYGHEMMKLDKNVQVLFFLNKYPVSHSHLYKQVKIQIEQEPKPGENTKNIFFQRPFFMLKSTNGRGLYGKVLQYFWKKLVADHIQLKSSPQGFLSKTDNKKFPFRLFKKIKKQVINENGEKSITFEQQPIPIQKQNLELVTFDENQSLFMRLRNTQQVKPRRLLTFTNKLTEDIRKMQPKSRKVDNLMIEECINAFCRTQIIDKQWYCPQCKQIQSISKAFSFMELPRILVISLSRFKSDPITGEYSKNEKYVLYSEYLDFSPFLKGEEKAQPSKYRLFAVANHISLSEAQAEVSSISGHYTCYVRDKEVWKKCDDEQITEISLNTATSSQRAYILFYERVD